MAFEKFDNFIVANKVATVSELTGGKIIEMEVIF